MGNAPLNIIQENSASLASINGARNFYELPSTWPELNAFLTKLNSGALADGAIAGISSPGRDLEEEAKERRKKEQECCEAIVAMNELSKQLQKAGRELEKALQELFDLDPLNRGRFERLQQVIQQKKVTDEHWERTSETTRRLETMLRQSEDEFNKVLQDGINSGNEAQARAARIVQERQEAGENVITISYRLEGERGANPQHLVYRDAKGDLYIKNGNGEPFYIRDLPLDAEQRDKIEAEIKRQREGTERRPAREKFGDEDPAAAQRFETANAALQDEIGKNNEFILFYDEYLKQGRDFRREIYQKMRESRELQEESIFLQKQIDQLEEEIGASGGGRGRQKLEEIQARLVQLNQQREAYSSSLSSNMNLLSQRNEVMQGVARFLIDGNYSQENFLERLPDKQLAASVQQRLDELKEQKRQLEEQRVINRQQEEDIKKAQGDIEALRKSGGIYNTNVKRKDWIAADPGADYLRDQQGNIINYDRVAGYFYSVKKNEATGEISRVTYRDPNMIIGFFRDVWQNHKRLGNEAELGDMTISAHLADIDLTIGHRKITISTIDNALDIQEEKINDEISRITSSQTADAGGGPRNSNQGRTVADTVAPLQNDHDYTRDFRSAATAPVARSASGPDLGSPAHKVEKPEISITSGRGVNQ